MTALTESPAEPEQTPPGPQAKPGFWAGLKLHILHPELTPRQVALSFGLGFAICWNPLIGTHTAMILLLCLVFRKLHRPLMLIAAFLNNPWTMVPIATASAYFGNLLMGRGLRLDLSGIHWREIGWHSLTTQDGFHAMYRMMKPILAPYLIGGGVLSLLALPIGYFLLLTLSRRLRRLHLPHLHLPHFHHQDPQP